MCSQSSASRRAATSSRTTRRSRPRARCTRHTTAPTSRTCGWAGRAASCTSSTRSAAASRRTSLVCPTTGDTTRGNLRRGLALVRKRTPRGPARRVRFYEKADCGLCAEAYRALTRVRMRMPLEIERVDILVDPLLFDRYALRIPVLASGERELDLAGLDEGVIERWLTTLRP
ncbi:MAG: glutaredoxin family protein [Chloroflexi bacterium]|nr:MAG: glutaredoxin family protein [Chloroflexota bacterium]